MPATSDNSEIFPAGNSEYLILLPLRTAKCILIYNALTELTTL